MNPWKIRWRLFWLFFKANWLTTSGPASIGVLYDEIIGHDMSEREFVEAVGFSNVLPGSAAVKLSVFIGYPLGGILGVIFALLGAVLPPLVATISLLYVLQYYAAAAWLTRFTKGLEPAVAALIALVGWKFLRPDKSQPWRKKDLCLFGISMLGLLLNLPSPLVLALAGLTGVILYR